MEFNNVYHTKTMVEILRNQGHMNLALKLTEQILASQSENIDILQMNLEIKEEIKRSFEKFKRAGQTVRAVVTEVDENLAEDVVVTNEVIEVNLATDIETVMPTVNPQLLIVNHQIVVLENLLQHIQTRRQELGKAS